MFNSYHKFWLGYTSFRERTTRSDFWFALLVHAVIFVILGALSGIFASLSNPVLPDFMTALSWLFKEFLFVYFLATILPFLSLMIRRLRDIAMPWALIFLNFLPIGGTIALLIICTLKAAAANSAIKEFSYELTAPKINETGKVRFSQAMKHYFSGYVAFRGRTSRASFWWTQLIFGGATLIMVFLLWLSNYFDELIFQQDFITSAIMEVLLVLYLLGILLPQITIRFRRLRDVGLTTFSTIILFIVTASCLSFAFLLRRADSMSYGIHDFSLANQLLFLLGMILVLTFICLELMAADELTKEKENLFFRKKD